MLRSFLCLVALLVCSLDLQASFKVVGVDGEFCYLDGESFGCSYGNISLKLCGHSDLVSFIQYEEDKILAAARDNPDETIDCLLLSVPDVMNKTGFNTITKNAHVHQVAATHLRGHENVYFRFPSSMYFSLHESTDPAKLIGLMLTDEINADGDIRYSYSLKQGHDEGATHADVNLLMGYLARYLKDDLKKCVEIMQRPAHAAMHVIYDFKSFSTWSYINDAARIQRLRSIKGLDQSGLAFSPVYDATEQGWLTAKLNALGCINNLGLFQVVVLFRLVKIEAQQTKDMPRLALKQPFQSVCTPESKQLAINRKTLRDRRKIMAEFRDEMLSTVPQNKPRKFSRQIFSLLTPGFYQKLVSISSAEELLVFLAQEDKKYATSDLSLSPRLSRIDHPYDGFLRQVISDE